MGIIALYFYASPSTSIAYYSMRIMIICRDRGLVTPDPMGRTSGTHGEASGVCMSDNVYARYSAIFLPSFLIQIRPR